MCIDFHVLVFLVTFLKNIFLLLGMVFFGNVNDLINVEAHAEHKKKYHQVVNNNMFFYLQ